MGKNTGIPAPKRVTAEKMRVLQSFISCLFYLSQEAEKEGFQYIASVMKDSISKIDMLSRNSLSPPAAVDIIDVSLYEAMHFLHRLAGLPLMERSDFMKAFLHSRRNAVYRAE